MVNQRLVDRLYSRGKFNTSVINIFHVQSYSLCRISERNEHPVTDTLYNFTENMNEILTICKSYHVQEPQSWSLLQHDNETSSRVTRNLAIANKSQVKFMVLSLSSTYNFRQKSIHSLTVANTIRASTNETQWSRQ